MVMKRKEKKNNKYEGFRTVGSLWEGEYGVNVSSSDYKGILVFIPLNDKSKGTENFDLSERSVVAKPSIVKRIYCNDPYSEYEGKLYDLQIDLNNDKCTEEVDTEALIEFLQESLED